MTQQRTFLEAWSVDLTRWPNLLWCNDKQQIWEMRKGFRNWFSTVFKEYPGKLGGWKGRPGKVPVCNRYTHGRRRRRVCISRIWDMHFCRSLALRQWVMHERNDFESLQTSRFSEIDDTHAHMKYMLSMIIGLEIFTEIISHKNRNSIVLWKSRNIHLCKQSPYGDRRHRSPLLPQGDASPLFKPRTMMHLMPPSAFLSLGSPWVTGHIS